MNKQNKKLLNFWNKIKKPLMILSVVGNILFILFITLGAIATKKNKTQIVYADYSEITSLSNTRWVMKKPSEMTYSSHLQGLGFDINYLVSTSDGDYEITSNHLVPVDTRSVTLNIAYSTSPRPIRLPYYTVDYDDIYEVNYYYNNNGSTTRINLGDINMTFVIRDGDDLENTDLINWFITNSYYYESIQKESLLFEFNKQINYNAPFKTSLDSPFFSHTFNAGELGFEQVYDLPFFMSNGEVFNQILIWNWSGGSVRYKDINGNIRINDDTLSAYYGFMQYKNTVTNAVVEVNYRNFVLSYVGQDGNDTQGYLDFGSEWTNDNYRSLSFFSVLTSSQITTLSQFNNQNFGLNGFTSVNEDVGLGSVFSLISTSFGAFTNIFKIQILPNITIGLLLFLPLIVGIILFIIWLIKR